VASSSPQRLQATTPILDPQYEAAYRGAAYLQQERGHFADAQALLQTVTGQAPLRRVAIAVMAQP